MNPLIHGEGEDDIGKDNSLVFSFTPKQWLTWENTLENYQPTPKALEMHKELMKYLAWAQHNTFEAPLETSEATPSTNEHIHGMTFREQLSLFAWKAKELFCSGF
jgi:hypothetical protein